jgi:hypothetical protein
MRVRRRRLLACRRPAPPPGWQAWRILRSRRDRDSRSLVGVPLPPIVQVGDPILRTRASEVAPDKIRTPELQTLFATMIAAMRSAPGVGLAAPQIDVPLRVIALEDREELMSRLTPDERRERGAPRLGCVSSSTRL